VHPVFNDQPVFHIPPLYLSFLQVFPKKETQVYLRKVLISILALVLAAFPGVSIATISAQSGEGISVLVTADRTEEEELKSSAHTTIITAEEIAASGKSDLVSVLESVAGITFRSYAGPEQAQVAMRGFGENSFGRVLVLLDGRRLNSMDMQGIQWLSISLQSVERIEIVRGGNSVLYGNSAVAGVINIITRGPVREREFASTLMFGGQLSDTYGWSQKNLEQIHFGLGNPGYDLDVNLEHQSTDGYRDRTKYQAVGTNIGFTGRPTDIFSTSLGLAYTQSSYQLPGSLTETLSENSPETAVNTEDDGEEYLITLDGGLEWLPGLNTSVFLDGSYSYQWRGANMSSWYSFSDTAYHTGRVNPRVVIETPYSVIPLKIVTGVDVYISSLEKADYSDEGRASADLRYEYSSGLQTYGGYLDVSAELREGFGLSLGSRYDTARIAAVRENRSLDDAKWHSALVFDGSLRWNPMDRTKLYFKGGTIFRYPFTDEQAGFYAGTFYSDLKPEKGWDLETGFSLAGGRAGRGYTVDGSVYLLQISDEIVADPVTWAQTNLDATRRIGGDLELKYSPLRVLKLFGNYSYVHAVFNEGVNDGKYIPLVPAHSAEAGLTVAPTRGLEIEPSASFVSEAYQGGDNANSQTKIEAYWLLDLVVRYSFPGEQGLQLVLRGENLLDRIYSPFVYYGGYYPAPGRSVSLSANYRY
jgi:iron complex outermembrane receptor protein